MDSKPLTTSKVCFLGLKNTVCMNACMCFYAAMCLLKDTMCVHAYICEKETVETVCVYCVCE